MLKVLRSADYAGPSGAGLGPFLAEVDPRGPAALVVFAPPSDGPWVDEVRRATVNRVGRIRVVIAVDAVRDGSAGATWRDWFLEPRAETGTLRSELEHVGRALSKLRCEVVIIDRVSGRILGDGLRLSMPKERAA